MISEINNCCVQCLRSIGEGFAAMDGRDDDSPPKMTHTRVLLTAGDGKELS